MDSTVIIKAIGDLQEHSTLELGSQEEFDALCKKYRRIAKESEKVEGRVGQSEPRF